TTGAYQLKVPLPFTPGMDAAGTVRTARPELGLGAGQRVAVLVSAGVWQEVISPPPERILPLPDGLSLEAAAALPLNYLTGLLALARRGRAQPRETLLVHGAACAVGTAAPRPARRHPAGPRGGRRRRDRGGPVGPGAGAANDRGRGRCGQAAVRVGVRGRPCRASQRLAGWGARAGWGPRGGPGGG